jgi:hypothetical protein
MASELVKSSVAAAMVIMPTVAFAHTEVGDTSGLVQGFGHPISGLDHILAMLMVGIFAFQLGGRALWLVPMTFVGVMAVGGMLGIAGIGVPFVEIGIALSVVVLGAIVAFNVKASVAAGDGRRRFVCYFSRSRSRSRNPGGRRRCRLCCWFPDRDGHAPSCRNQRRLPHWEGGGASRFYCNAIGREPDDCSWRCSSRWHPLISPRGVAKIK